MNIDELIKWLEEQCPISIQKTDLEKKLNEEAREYQKHNNNQYPDIQKGLEIIHTKLSSDGPKLAKMIAFNCFIYKNHQKYHYYDFQTNPNILKNDATFQLYNKFKTLHKKLLAKANYDSAQEYGLFIVELGSEWEQGKAKQNQAQSTNVTHEQSLL